MMLKTYINNRGKISECYYFDSPIFSVDGKNYRIVYTENYGRGALDARHTIRGEVEEKAVELRALVGLYNKNRLV